MQQTYKIVKKNDYQIDILCPNNQGYKSFSAYLKIIYFPYTSKKVLG